MKISEKTNMSIQTVSIIIKTLINSSFHIKINSRTYSKSRYNV